MATAVFPAPFPTGYRLIDGNQLNAALAVPLLSSQDGLTAKAGGGKTNALPLTAAINRISVAATAADSVLLPASQVGLEIVIENDGASAIQVFGKGTDTINGVATGTGISQPAGTYITYRCTTAGQWRYTTVASGTFGALTATTLNGNTVTTGTGAFNPGYTGTFVANGATAVVVANTNVTANSVISYGLKTVGGTPAAKPYESAITPTTGFSVKAAAGDTSTYNYTIIG